MVAAMLSGVVLAGVLGSVLSISKSGYLLNNYIDMESQARSGLEIFALDARMAKNIAWSRADPDEPLTAVSLTSPDGVTVSYAYDSAAGTLARQPATGAATTLISGITALTFTAYRYDNSAALVTLVPTDKTLLSLNNETKMIQISLSARRTRTTLSDATNTVISARFVLRNKIITE